jgi:hypothetical protein
VQTRSDLDTARHALATQSASSGSGASAAGASQAAAAAELVAHVAEMQRIKAVWRALVEGKPGGAAALAGVVGVASASGAAAGGLGGSGGDPADVGGGSAAAQARVAELEAEVRSAGDALARCVSERDAARRESARAVREATEVKCLLKVFQAGSAGEARGEQEIRAAEKVAITERDDALARVARAESASEALHRRIDDLTRQLEAAAVAAPSSSSAGAGSSSAAASSGPSSSSNSADAGASNPPHGASTDAELRDRCEALSSENAALQSELEEIVSAFDTLERQCADLTRTLAAKEHSAELIVSDRQRADRVAVLLAEEREALTRQAAAANDKVIGYAKAAAAAELRAKHAEAAATASAKESSEQARKAAEQQGRATNLFDHLHAMEALNNDVKRQLAQAAAEIEARTAEAARAQDALRAAGEDHATTKRKLERARREAEARKRDAAARGGSGAAGGPGAAGSSSSSSGISDLQVLHAEVDKYRDMTRCSVCRTNPKSVVITKCMHTFCSACIRRNLEVRNRKCPGCSTKYGQEDVSEIFLGFD